MACLSFFFPPACAFKRQRAASLQRYFMITADGNYPGDLSIFGWEKRKPNFYQTVHRPVSEGSFAICPRLVLPGRFLHLIMLFVDCHIVKQTNIREQIK